MLTWIRFPDGGSIAGDISGPLRAGVIIIIDAVEYVVDNVGQIAADETPRSRRYGKVRQFVPIAYLKVRAGAEPAVPHAGRIEARARTDRTQDATAHHG